MQELTEPQKRWIAALRSGKYKQGIKYLKKDGCHCALGVACEIFKDELGLKEEVMELDVGDVIAYNGDVFAVAPKAVVAHLGLFGVLGDSSARRGESVSSLNDSGKSFEFIATVLESPLNHHYFRS